MPHPFDPEHVGMGIPDEKLKTPAPLPVIPIQFQRKDGFNQDSIL
jgi:hypothetical protein